MAVEWHIALLSGGAAAWWLWCALRMSGFSGVVGGLSCGFGVVGSRSGGSVDMLVI